MKGSRQKGYADQALAAIVRHYLESREFNGIPGDLLSNQLKLSPLKTREVIRTLRNRRLVDVVGPSTFVNPHIRPFTRISLESQDRDLERSLTEVCIYPTWEVLTRTVNPLRYFDRTFTLELALGEGQLELRYFRSEVLEHYFSHQDRFHVHDEVAGGSILTKDTYYLSIAEDERSEIFRGPRRYGRRLLKETGSALCNILWDLSVFPPPEQAYWRAFELRMVRFIPLREDSHFRVWVDRNLGGQWADSRDPIRQIYQLTARINESLGEELFVLPKGRDGLPHNPDLVYPLGDNVKAYVSAHVELEKVVVGSLNARLLNRLLKAKSIKRDHAWGTLRRLQAFLHNSSHKDQIIVPLKKVRGERDRIHQIDPKIFAPEDQMRRFLHDCNEVVSALELLEREVSSFRSS